MAKKSTCLAEAGRRRVLYIITKSVWGGAAKYVYDLAISLNKEEFNVSVAAGNQNELVTKLNKANITFFQIRGFQRQVNIFKDLIAGWELFKLFLKIKPDVIHVNSSKAGGIAGLAAFFYKLLTNRRPKLIFTAHGWAFAEDRPKWQIALIKLFSKITALFYNTIICVSEYDRKLAFSSKIAPENKLATIHNGLDISKLSFFDRQTAQQKLLSRNSNYVIGTIAEWTKNKGLSYLIEAIVKIKPENKIDLVLIGSGENHDQEKINYLIKKYNLKNVYLYKQIPQAASYLKAFNIFVLPSVKEGLPYTILEAMVAQVPIIATRVGGIVEMVDHNQSGLLIPSKNSQKLADKIIYLLNNPKIGKKLSQKASQKIEQEFSLEKMVKETTKFYY